MAYSLRPRVRNTLLRDEQEYIGGSSSSEEDNMSIQSNTDTSCSDYSEAEDAEDTTLN